MLRQWNNTYNQGKKLIPGLTILSSAGYFFLSYYQRTASSSVGGSTGLFKGIGGIGAAKIYALAGVIGLSVIPYTRLLMWGTNVALHNKEKETRALETEARRGEEVSIEEEKSAKYLVDHWGLLNLGRAGLLGVAALLGLGVTV